MREGGGRVRPAAGGGGGGRGCGGGRAAVRACRGRRAVGPAVCGRFFPSGSGLYPKGVAIVLSWPLEASGGGSGTSGGFVGGGRCVYRAPVDPSQRTCQHTVCMQSPHTRALARARAPARARTHTHTHTHTHAHAHLTHACTRAHTHNTHTHTHTHTPHTHARMHTHTLQAENFDRAYSVPEDMGAPLLESALPVSGVSGGAPGGARFRGGCAWGAGHSPPAARRGQRQPLGASGLLGHACLWHAACDSGDVPRLVLQRALSLACPPPTPRLGACGTRPPSSLAPTPPAPTLAPP